MHTVAWSHNMEGPAQTCVERYCELANKKVEQLCKVSHPCLDVHQFKQEELESVGSIVTSMLTKFVKMLVPGTNWETRHSVVCQQTCKMDSGMRQTTGKIDFIHSSHK